MNAAEWKAKGNTALQGGKTIEAIGCFTEGLKYEPNNAVLYSNRSAAHAQLKDWNAALEDGEKAVECKPDWSKAHSRKGLALYKLNRYENSIAAYKNAVELDPNNATLKESLNLVEDALRASESNVLGEEKLNKGKPAQAIPFLDTAIRQDPNAALYYANRSKAKSLCGKYIEALQDADEVIRRRPDWHRGYQRRAEALSSQGKYADAASVYAYAIQLQPENEQLTKAFNFARQEDYLQQQRKQQKKTFKDLKGDHEKEKEELPEPERKKKKFWQ